MSTSLFKMGLQLKTFLLVYKKYRIIYRVIGGCSFYSKNYSWSQDVNELINPFKVLAVLQTHIPERLLESHYAEQNPAIFGKREVILSLYLSGE